ncbi:hypothetical protein IscW_ISCW002333, partial [Ixodes scapularis]
RLWWQLRRKLRWILRWILRWTLRRSRRWLLWIDYYSGLPLSPANIPWKDDLLSEGYDTNGFLFTKPRLTTVIKV